MPETHNYFIEQALNEAKLEGCCKSDHPRVGAVVVTNETIVAKAHHGEQTNEHGCVHAEALAITRAKDSVKDLSNATLYTTLEPCTGKVRRGSNKACTEHIHEVKIPRVVIGSLDPDQRITGKGFRYLIKNNIEVLIFPKDQLAQAESVNSKFLNDQEGKTYVGLFSDNKIETVEMVKKMCLKAQRSIKLFIHPTTAKYKLPDETAEKIAEHLVEQNENKGKGVIFSVVMVINKELIQNDEFLNALINRHDLYKKKGASKFINLRYLEKTNSANTDVLIIDDVEALISFSTITGVHCTQMSLSIQQHENALKHINDWYDRVINTQETTLSEKDFQDRVNQYRK